MNKQTQILKVFNNDKELILKKSEIIEKGSIYYYYNTEKHVGDTLTRMVKNGLLIHVKIGHYKLGTHIKTKKAVDLIINKNQTKLL